MKSQIFILTLLISTCSRTLVAQDDPTSVGTASSAQIPAAEQPAREGAGHSTAHFQDRLRGVIQRVPSAGRSLVIRSSEMDPKEQANLEEDLKVMSRILEKTLGGAVGPQQGHSVLGIDVFFGPGSSPIRGLYLDGYGALFTLNVGFPLVAPAKNEDEKEKTQTNSAWDEARQEVYGQQTDGRAIYVRGQEYDEQKVNRLKDAVLDALKNAAHIRTLKSDDSVTVCVFGGSTFVPLKSKAASKTDETASKPIYSVERLPQRNSVLTIRVKKSDVDAFAKDKLNLEEFRKKAKIVSYAGGPEPGDGVTVFGGGSSGGFGTTGGF